MADILSGTSGHSSFAPLSHAQTVQLCQHLNDQISQLQDEIANLHERNETSENAVGGMRQDLASSNTMIQSLKAGLVEANNAIESTRNEVGRNTGGGQKLQSALESTQEHVEAIRQAQKITNTFTEKLEGSLQRNIALTNEVREDIERRLGTNFEKLQDQVGRLDLKLNQLTEYDELDKIASQEGKEVSRATDMNLKNLKDEHIKTNTVVAMLEARLQERTGGMKDTAKNLEETNSLILRMHEDYEHMKSDFQDLQQSCKQMGAHVNQVHDGMDDMTRSMKDVTGRLDLAASGLDTARSTIDQQKGNIQSLKESHEMAHKSIRNLSESLADTHATAHQLKAGLKETQAFVLPNLKMGSPTGAAGGSNLQEMSRTPRGGAKAGSGGLGIKKVDRGLNLGSTANSLAWI